MTRLLLLSCLALLSGSACTKEKNPLDTLPEATQTGVNTMGCLIDGRAFQPSASSGIFSRPALGALRFPDGQTTLSFNYYDPKNNDKRQDLSLELLQVRGVGLYTLNQLARPGFPRVPYALYRSTGPMDNRGNRIVREYRTSPLATGQVLITHFDSVAKIISGTFDFTAQQVDGTGTVQVTQGRFDMPYR